MSNELSTTNNGNIGFVSSMKVETKRDKIVLAKALNAAESMKDAGTEPFEIIALIQQPGKRSQSGEDCVNTYLVKRDGTALFSQSDGIKRSAQEIMGIFTPDEIAEGLTVFVAEKKLANGRTLKVLDFILDD